MSLLLTTHVEAHLDELESLLPLRAEAEEGRQWTLPRVLELDERIAAHEAALRLFADDMLQVMEPFVDEHPLACAFMHDGTRPVCDRLDDSELVLRARIALPDEAAALAAALWAMSPSVEVYVAIADLGRPVDVPPLIMGFDSTDPHCAVAAGAAFTVLTGLNCDSLQRVVLSSPDGHEPDEFAREFLAEAWLPDPRSALSGWERLRPALAQALRINRGFSVDDATAATHPGIDRREAAAARLRFRRRG